ncbi:hypothetical protein HPB52_000650 [Rhipicephalus sanguineus]|uniref:Uncharacterized protein n=1 Tax=Rhipicephalus sanguineus TaxID=34632 RepID=A0A9D4SWD1_RHISA|nr:hypothetical protein HPB52_014980 [Rhipicephalus sanguineus]KAH7971621.1 hypothetical protein HPB52_000650 [Rhipicephalus sanguineus]
MAASDVRQTEAVQTAADEKWVFLQDDGEGLKELLLEEQDGDVKGEKESLENAVEGQESALDVGRFLWWCRSACKDVLVRNTTCDDSTWDDKRPYVLGVALCVITALHLLAAFASLAECEMLQVVLAILGYFTMAVLCPATFSYATRFLSLLAAKASVVKRLEVNVLLFGLLATTFVIRQAARFAFLYEVYAGITVSSTTGQQAWYLQLPVAMVRWPALIGAIVFGPPMVLPTKTDLKDTFHTFKLHWRETEDARKLFTKRWLFELTLVPLVALIAVVCVFVEVESGVIPPDPATTAASGGI